MDCNFYNDMFYNKIKMLLTYIIVSILISGSLAYFAGSGIIVTVPALLWVGFDLKVAMAMSLGIVGIASAYGAFVHYQRDNVAVKTGLLFGSFSTVGAIVGVEFAQFLSDQILITVLAFVMIVAAGFLFRDAYQKPLSETSHVELGCVNVGFLKLNLEGFLIGIITGLIGIGGGFLVVPVLVFFANIPFQRAMGTAFFVIAMKSLIAFSVYLFHVSISWPWFLILSFLAFIGVHLTNNTVPGKIQYYLKKVYPLFLTILAVYLLYKYHVVY